MKAPRSVSRENSWSNEPSAVDTSQSSDHQTISEIVSSEPEIVKNGPNATSVLAKPLQLQRDEGGPVPSIGSVEHRSSVEAHRPLPSATAQLNTDIKSSESAKVIDRLITISALPVTTISASVIEPSVIAEHNTEKESHEEKVYDDRTNRSLVPDNSLDKRRLWDEADNKHCMEKSDSESTPKNDLSLREEDVSVRLHEVASENQTSSTLSSRDGTKTSPVHEKHQPPVVELHKNEMPTADVEPSVHEASPTRPGLSQEDNRDLSQPEGNCSDDVSKSSHSAHSYHDAQSVSSTGGGRHSTSSRHSASGASRAGSGASKAAPVVAGSRSKKADDISSRSDSIRSSISSKAASVYDNCSSIAESISTASDIVRREVSGSIGSRSGSRSGSIHSNVSSKTFTIDSEGSGKSRQADADAEIPENVILHRSGSEERQQQGDVGADTDDDVADLEPDQSLHMRPAETVNGIVDKMPAAAEPSVRTVENRAGQELRIDEDVANLTDEQLPEELDDSDVIEDGRGLIYSAGVAGNLQRDTSEPQSDTSESRTGRNSDDLRRIIRRAAAAVESFVTDDERASGTTGDRNQERFSDGRSEKAADSATRNLLSDAIDEMLAVRKQKLAAAEQSKNGIPPALPLSPSALTDSAKSTASTSSGGQVMM